MHADRIFEALASGARRQMLRRLAQAEMTTTELVAHFPMSAPAVSRHLSVLENAGLVASRLVRDTVIEALSGFAAELSRAAQPEAARAKKQKQRDAI